MSSCKVDHIRGNNPKRGDIVHITPSGYFTVDEQEAVGWGTKPCGVIVSKEPDGFVIGRGACGAGPVRRIKQPIKPPIKPQKTKLEDFETNYSWVEEDPAKPSKNLAHILLSGDSTKVDPYEYVAPPIPEDTPECTWVGEDPEEASTNLSDMLLSGKSEKVNQYVDSIENNQYEDIQLPEIDECLGEFYAVLSVYAPDLAEIIYNESETEFDRENTSRIVIQYWEKIRTQKCPDWVVLNIALGNLVELFKDNSKDNSKDKSKEPPKQVDLDKPLPEKPPTYRRL